MVFAVGLNLSQKMVSPTSFEAFIYGQHHRKAKENKKAEEKKESKPVILDIEEKDILNGLDWRHTGIKDKWLADHFARAFAADFNLSWISHADLENVNDGAKFLALLNEKKLSPAEFISFSNQLLRDIDNKIDFLQQDIQYYQDYDKDLSFLSMNGDRDANAKSFKIIYDRIYNENSGSNKNLHLPELPNDNRQITHRKRKEALINFCRERINQLQEAKDDMDAILDSSKQ